MVSFGTAAIDLVLSQSRRDDLIVAPQNCYGGTHRLLTTRRNREQFNAVFVDQNDDRLLASTRERSPSFIFIETPSGSLTLNDVEHHHPTGCRRYLYSTNHKHIGTMNFAFSMCAELIGGLLYLFGRAPTRRPMLLM